MCTLAQDGRKHDPPLVYEKGRGFTTASKADEFDIVAACLFNQTGQWSYLFSSTTNLQRRTKHPDYLVVMQKVPYLAQGHWHERLEDAIADVLGP